MDEETNLALADIHNELGIIRSQIDFILSKPDHGIIEEKLEDKINRLSQKINEIDVKIKDRKAAEKAYKKPSML